MRENNSPRYHTLLLVGLQTHRNFLPETAFGDWYLGKTGYTSQQIGEPEDPVRPNNLWEPVDAQHDYGAHGAFNDRAHSRNWQLWADTHRGWLAIGGAGIVSVIGAAVFWKKR